MTLTRLAPVASLMQVQNSPETSTPAPAKEEDLACLDLAEEEQKKKKKKKTWDFSTAQYLIF